MRDPSILKCVEVVELATEFLSEALDAEDRVRIEQHLLVCPPCTTYVAQIRTTAELSSGLHDDRPADPDSALLELFRRWKQR